MRGQGEHIAEKNPQQRARKGRLLGRRGTALALVGAVELGAVLSHSSVVTASDGLIAPQTASPSQQVTPAVNHVLPIGKRVGKESTTYSGRNFFHYVTGTQNVASTQGAIATFTQNNPYVTPPKIVQNTVLISHTLTEMWVTSPDYRQTLEFGEIVDGNNNSKPSLFTFDWIDGKGDCYNKCHYKPVANTIQPGDTIMPGETGSFGIVHSDYQHAWDIEYNDSIIGYYPDKTWHNSFTRAGTVKVFGEVASYKQNDCSDMGTGEYGINPGSARISNFRLIGSTAMPDLQVVASDPSLYSADNISANGFNFGGPGDC